MPGAGWPACTCTRRLYCTSRPGDSFKPCKYSPKSQEQVISQERSGRRPCQARPPPAAFLGQRLALHYGLFFSALFVGARVVLVVASGGGAQAWAIIQALLARAVVFF